MGNGKSLHAAVKVFRARLEKEPSIAIAVAAIQALTTIVRDSTMDTIHGLQIEIREARDALTQQVPASISLKAGCDLFNCYVTRTWDELMDFEECRKQIVQRGDFF